jgi:ComF family protein
MTLSPRPEAAATVYAAPRRRVVSALRDRVLHLVLPAPCLGCHAPIAGPVERTSLGLCSVCRGRLRPVSLLESPTGIDRLLALWAYGPPLDAVIHRLKFGRLDYLGRQLGEVLAETVCREIVEAGSAFDAVVPVPLHWWRQLSRGFNQAEEIARPLAAQLGLRCLPALGRRRATSAQSSLARTERLRNLRGAFRVRRRFASRMRGARILLLDDVTTTGATLAAAAAALREAGAAEVLAAVVAQTPRAVRP